MECVQRIRADGPKGQPLGIREFADIAGKLCQRQKARTRILCDYLARQNKVDPESVWGYDREEYTHTAVA